MRADRLLDCVWPRRCEICGAASDRPGRHVCSQCLMRVPFIPSGGCCARCGVPVEGAGPDSLCAECRKRTGPLFDAATCAVRFEGAVREAVIGFKFNRRFWLRDDFADWMEAAARSRFDVDAVDAVLPMPTSLFHRIDRGYDQCVYLASALSGRIGRRLLRRAVVRKGNPRRQADLGGDERRENVRGTFRVARPDAVRGRTLLLVDDVMTTGSTLSECAGELRRAGAWRVWCVALARSIMA